MVRTLPRVRRPRQFVPYRPLIERLEDRLPPGDAVLAGLLAAELMPSTGRAAGLVPADMGAAPPAQARRLAEPVSFDLELLAAPASPVASAPGGVSVEAALDDLGALTRPRSPGRSVAPTPASTVALAPGDGSTPHFGFSTQHAVHGALTQPRLPSTPADYRLDQAVAAVALPSAEGTRAGGVQALFDLSHPTTGPFPSNVFTVFDDTQNTWRRINLPYPDCSVYVSDCEDIAVLNELDGFNMQPRLSIPFSGPIDVDSVNYTNVFLVSLGSTTEEEGFMPRGYGVGINQVVWDVETNTLHVESDELLAQHTRFALYVTNGVRNADGNPVGATEEFRNFRQTVQGDYQEQLHDAMLMAGAYGFRERDIAVASVFTTQSATAMLEKIRDQIKAEVPEPADFNLGPKGERTLFNFDEVTGITFNQQRQVNPPLTPVTINLEPLRIVPRAVGRLAYGKFLSPDYLAEDRTIPTVGTRTGTPTVHQVNELYFTLFLPSGPKPKAGWPVVILGGGGGSNKEDTVAVHGAKLAERGVAGIALNRVSHGYGPLGTLTVNRTAGGPMTFSAGGRGMDIDGDGAIGSSEGVFATTRTGIIGDSGTIRQNAAELMQLVRVIGVGMDADADGVRDLDASRVYYLGRSGGTREGAMLLAVEPDVRVGELNVPPAWGLENNRLTVGGRPTACPTRRTPPLQNFPGITAIDAVPVTVTAYYNENKPLRDGVPYTVRLEDGNTYEIRSPVVNTVAGAAAIQACLERFDWVAMSGDTSAYAPHLRRAPLPGVPAKSFIFSFAKGDQQATNPGTTAVIRAGRLADCTTYYRHDLLFAEDPTVAKNPHGFMAFITSTNPRVQAIARGAQEQMAVFFASDGKTILHPEPARFFEVPIKGPLPEGLNYIP